MKSDLVIHYDEDLEGQKADPNDDRARPARPNPANPICGAGWLDLPRPKIAARNGEPWSLD